MELPGALGDAVDTLADKIRETVQEKPAVVFVSGALVLLALIALVIVLIKTSTRKEKVEAPEAAPFELDAPLFIPDAPSFQQDYYPSRIPGKVWSGDDIEQWFTAPDEKTMQSLEKANDKIINDILGAAP